MRFWKKLADALPHKSHQRADELHQCAINSCIQIPSIMFDKVFDCSICKVRFGEILAKDTIPYLITTDIQPSFTESSSGVVVCNKCVNHFGF